MVGPVRRVVLGRVDLDDEAFRAWEGICTELAVGAGGMFGSMTTQAEAQVERLSTLYAVLDCSPVIRLEHLRSAQARPVRRN